MHTPEAAITMGIANEVIDDIRREHGWSTEELAEICGYSRSRTNYFCNGQATPPAEFLASLYERTRDQRIINLVTGRLFTGTMVFDVEAAMDLSDSEALARFVEIRKEQTEADQAFLELIEKGLTPDDPEERQRYANYKRETLEAIAVTLKLLKSIDEVFNPSHKTVTV